MQSDENLFSSNLENEAVDKKNQENKNFRLMGGVYVIGISGVTAAVAGLVTSYVAKKKAKEYFKEFGKEQKPLLESPHSLALRALAWGTFWAVGICSITVFGVCKWYGIRNLEDLRTKIRQKRKPNLTQGRSEFENLTDLINYLNETSQSQQNPKGT